MRSWACKGAVTTRVIATVAAVVPSGASACCLLRFVSSGLRFYDRLLVSSSDRSLAVGIMVIFRRHGVVPTIASHRVLHTLESVFFKTF